MKTLEEMGVKIKRGYITESSSVDVNDVEISASSKKTTQLTLALPQASPIAATFSTEGLAHKVVKIWKSELQTGDQEFDDAVYIATETKETTAHMLQSSDLRALIRGLLVNGPVTIGGNTVTLTVLGHVKGEADEAVQLVNALLR